MFLCLEAPLRHLCSFSEQVKGRRTKLFQLSTVMVILVMVKDVMAQNAVEVYTLLFIPSIFKYTKYIIHFLIIQLKLLP